MAAEVNAAEIQFGDVRQFADTGVGLHAAVHQGGQ